MLHQLDDARRGAADEGERLLVGLVVFDAPAVVRGPPRPRARPGRARGAQADRARGPRPAGRAAPGMTEPPAAGARRGDRPRRHGRLPRPVRRVRPGRRRPARPRCSATRRTSPGSTRSGWASTASGTRRADLAWVVRAVELAVLAPIPLGTMIDLSTRGHRLPQGLGAPPDRGPRRGRRARALGPHRLGDDRHRPRAAGPRPGGVPGGVPRAARRRSSPAACPLPPTPDGAARHAARGPAPGHRPDGPREQRRLRRLPRGDAARRGPARGRACRRAIPRRIRLEYLVARDARRRRSSGDACGATRPTASRGWAWRLARRRRPRARPRAGSTRR